MIIDDDIALGKFFELASSDKTYVTGVNLNEIKGELLVDYTGVFQLNGSMITGQFEQKLSIRFRNTDDFESYINAIDIIYDNDDVTFTGYIYNISTPQFNVVKRSS